jgi:pyridoxamine 5'-phosphate oxidase
MLDKLSELRQNYMRASLDTADVFADPIAQFGQWFSEAKEGGLAEPNAFTLATCGTNMRPNARTLLLKGVEDGKFVFFTNFESRKGNEIAQNPWACMHFLWLELERQVRIEGKVNQLDEAAATTYFQSRPRDSQVGAWASPQSQAITGRGVLEENVKMIESRYQNDPVLPKPPNWGGYVLTPEYVEFWQGRPSRLHDRVAYSLNNGGAWSTTRLAP